MSEQTKSDLGRMPDEASAMMNETQLPSVTLTERQITLGGYLDDLHRRIGVYSPMSKPSEIFAGAIYGMQRERRDNQDWMSQVAHSLRELLYPIRSRINKRAALEQFGYRRVRGFIEDIKIMNRQLNDIAHHMTEPRVLDKPMSEREFENLVNRFERAMFFAFRLPFLNILNEIDRLLLDVPNECENQGMLLRNVHSLLRENSAKEYFYRKANEYWLEWLWENEFLDIIKGDKIREGVWLPEVFYLTRIARTAPAKTMEIILQIKVSPEMINKEAIDYIFAISANLPAEQLAKLVGTIRDDRWISIRNPSHLSEYQYDEIFKKLLDAKEHDSLMKLAEAILDFEDGKKSTSPFSDSEPFHLDSISSTGILKYLADLEDNHTVEKLCLVTKIVGRAAVWGSANNRYKFEFDDIDFFDLDSPQLLERYHDRNMRGLLMVMKILVEHLVGSKNVDANVAREIYGKFINTLPDDDMTMYRFKLFALSLRPEALKEEYKQALFRLFESKDQVKIISEVEYKESLRRSFFVLCEEDKRDYVNQVMDIFIRKSEESERKELPLQYGSMILSMISTKLTDEEKQRASSAGFEIDIRDKQKPMPTIGEVRCIKSRPPVSEEEFKTYSVVEISEKLKDEWTPQELDKLNSIGTYEPINAEGLGGLLEKDMPKRFQEYIDNADKFFEREILDQHYTYSYFHALRKTIENHKDASKEADWQKVIQLLTSIKESDESLPFEKRDGSLANRYYGWLADWDSVCSEMVYFLKEMLSEKNGLTHLFPKYRDAIFGVVGYLLSHPNPTTNNTAHEGELESAPLNIAANSVRGRAFELFASLFVYQDSKQFDQSEKVRIACDVKALYERVLEKENTSALMFMFGHYLANFYYYDKDWLLSLLPQIFPQNNKNKDLYMAAWEGYLAFRIHDLYYEPAIQSLYENGIMLTDSDYPTNRAYFKNPKESIAEHIAIAFIRRKKGQDPSLFKMFWEKGLSESQKHFVGFLGRVFISSRYDNDKDSPEEKRIIKRRLMMLWKCLLRNHQGGGTFTEFGSWANPDADYFDPKWLARQMRATLEKTGGELNWSHGLEESLVRLAEADPMETIKIMRAFLLDYKVRKGKDLYYIEPKWEQAMAILCKNPKTKEMANELIDELIRGNPIFLGWRNLVELE